MIAAILVVLVIVIASIFSVQNAMPVAISFMLWHFDGSLAIITLLFFLAGIITGMAVLTWARIRHAARKRKIELDKKPPEGVSSPN